jgi:hypothetical protein
MIIDGERRTEGTERQDPVGGEFEGSCLPFGYLGNVDCLSGSFLNYFSYFRGLKLYYFGNKRRDKA